MLLYGSRMPDAPRFARSFEAARSDGQAAADLWDATREVTRLRDNSTARAVAMERAYEARNREIFEATGRQLSNPYRPEFTQAQRDLIHRGNRAADALALRARDEARWRDEAAELARIFPEHARAIAADRPVLDDAMRLAREAEAEFERAMGAAAGLPAWRRFGNVIGGGIAGALRDPLQVTALLLGGGPSGARLAAGRIGQVMLTEAMINAGVEGVVVAASQDWRRSAGLENSLGGNLAQIGLAAAFGGAFGGLLQGGREVFRAMGRTPPAALERIAAGEPREGDFAALTAALGRDMDPQTRRLARVAEENAALDAEAFGPPPEGVSAAEAERLAAEALRRAEDPPDAPAPGPAPLREDEDRWRQIDRIVRADTMVGRMPRKPQGLIDFLRASGGIRDESGELASRGIGRDTRGVARRLARAGGRNLDNAREIAAEAGYLDKEFGDFQTAMDRSTPDDLLRAIDEELSGIRRWTEHDGQGDIAREWIAYEARLAARDSYRRLLEETDTAAEALGLPGVDDAVLSRAARMAAETGEDPAVALERALEEDYRAFLDSDAALETRHAEGPDFDLPFFPEDRGTGPEARGAAGTFGAGRLEPARAAGDAADGGRFPRAGGGEDQPPGLREAGATPEPGTNEAVEIAELALLEARRPGSGRPAPAAAEATPAGEQIDPWDAMPVARDADGSLAYTTHAEMVADARRSDYLADLVASCRD